MVLIIYKMCQGLLGYSLYKTTHGATNLFEADYCYYYLFQIPSVLVMILLIDIWGRKPLLVFTQLFTAVSCLILPFLSPASYLSIVLSMLANTADITTYYSCGLYIRQIFPTSIRNTAVGTTFLLASIILYIITGVIFTWVFHGWPEWFYVIVGAVCGLLGGLLALLLPDTVGFTLPDTLDNVEEIKNNSKPMWQCGIKKDN